MDYMLQSRLTATSEMQGLFRHAVDGVANLLARGDFRVPPKVQAAHDLFARNSDQIQSFLKFVEETQPGKCIAPIQLNAQYQEWALAEGHKPLRRQILLTRAAEAWSSRADSGAFEVPRG